MKKTNIKIKSNISLEDKVKAIEGIAAAYFTGGDYTPYYSEVAEIVTIATFFIDGVEFEDGESVYECVKNDYELMTIVSKAQKSKEMMFVQENVKDKVDFIKNQIIHSHADTDKIIEACNVIIDSFDNFSKLKLNQMTDEDMNTGLKIMKQLADKDFNIDDMSKIIKNAVGFDMDKASSEILEEKNKQIKELMKYKTFWEGRNVQSSGKVVQMPKKE